MADLEVKWTDPSAPGSFSAVDKLYRSQTRHTRKEVNEFLRGKPSYSLHHPVRYSFPRNRVVVSGVNSQWDTDLCVLINYGDSNDGYRYILVSTDTLSHFLYTEPLKTKSGREVAAAFRRTFARAKPRVIRSDSGSEFKNALVQRVFSDNGVRHFTTKNEVKSHFAERVIKTIHLRLSRYFTEKQTHRWIDVLPEITSSYNKTYHRSIKMAPASVTQENEDIAWSNQYESTEATPDDGEYKLQIGDLVRISHLRIKFQREYLVRFTGELFKVTSRRVRAGKNIYGLHDWLDEEISGWFYEMELIRVVADAAGMFNIEKVIRSRKPRGKPRQFLIKWANWPDKFNSWVSEEDMTDV